MHEPLTNCPFCGSTEGFYVVKGSTFRWRFLSCRNCGEATEVRHKNNSDEPDSYIADWNAAAPYPAMLRKEIDTLRAQLAEKTVQIERVKQQRDRMLEWEVDGTLKQRFWDAAVEQEGEIRSLKAQLDELKAARIAYANEFPLNADGEPDVGNIHANIRSLKAQLAEAQRDAERLDWIIEHRAYVVSDPDCCDGYWLNYARPDGTIWTQATEHETPRAAIDAARTQQEER